GGGAGLWCAPVMKSPTLPAVALDWYWNDDGENGPPWLPVDAILFAGVTCKFGMFGRPCANAHAAPLPPLSKFPPTMAVLPSPEIATAMPCSGPTNSPPVPTN